LTQRTVRNTLLASVVAQLGGASVLASRRVMPSARRAGTLAPPKKSRHVPLLSYPLETNMKSAYELAMERLIKSAPSAKLTAGQKTQLAELESKYKARIAEREIGLRDEMVKAAAAGEREQVRELEQRLVHERRKLRDELEVKKEAVRHKAG
jgi:hypothetical protein